MKCFPALSTKRKGVALLFALGILSLLLVLGLAFVANAVISQKAAANNSSRSQAKMLAQSAINRVAIAVMEYQWEVDQLHDQAITSNKTDILVTDLSTVVSYDDQTKINGTAEKIDDKLSTYLPYYLPINDNDSTYYKDLDSADSKRIPSWIFITNGSSTNPRLIGRYAYRVLPPISTTRLNLDYVLRGINPANHQDTVQAYANINELPLSPTSPSYTESERPLSFLQTALPNTILPAQNTSNSNFNLNDLVGSFDRFFSAWQSNFPPGTTPITPANSFNLAETPKRNWLKRWFDDGVTPPDLEVYKEMHKSGSDDIIRYKHRFNIAMSPTEWDNLSNLSTDASPEEAVDAIMHDSAPFRDDDASGYTLKTSSDSPLPTTKNAGLPFLNIIGNDRASFSTLEYRRKQIAANLIDYNDSGSQPTSDVWPASSGWSQQINNSAKWPHYTGNEKTAYINEVALAVKTDLSLENVAFADGVNADLTLKVTMTPEIIAELIKIYDSIPDKYKFYTSLKSMTVTANAYAADCQVSYEDQNVPPTLHSDVTISTELSLNHDFSWPATTDIITIDFPDTTDNSIGTFDTGYAVNSKVVSQQEFSFDFSSLLKNAADSQIGAANITKYTKAGLGKVRVEISKVTFELGAFSLDNQANSCSVDFVRWNKPTTIQRSPTSELKLYADVTLNDSSSTDSTGWIPADKISAIPNDGHRYFYIGGMETIDPRQNLNVNEPDSTTSDWFLSLRLADHKNQDENNLEVLSMTISPTESGAKRYKGKRNTWSDPSNPSQETRDIGGAANPLGTLNSGEYDLEETSDPAYTSQNLSTAYIPDTPMESLWELGAIHRAAAWETINLTNAESPAVSGRAITPEDYNDYANKYVTKGTTYQGGDGGILDQVKLTQAVRSYGKIDINMLRSNFLGFDSNFDNIILASLASEIDLKKSYNSSTSGNKPSTTTVTQMLSKLNGTSSPFLQRSQLLYHDTASTAEWYNHFITTISSPDYPKTKAGQEELIGKLINLFKTDPAQVTTFQVDVIAQSILDVDGNNIVKLKDDDTPLPSRSTAYNSFDVDLANNVYYDEITGEVKMRVTFDRNPQTGKIKVRQIEYID